MQSIVSGGFSCQDGSPGEEKRLGFRNYQNLMVLGCVSALIGCTTWTERREEELRVLDGSKLTSSNGLARVKIPLTSADHAVMLEAIPPSGFQAFVAKVEDSEGNLLRDYTEDLQRSRQRTGAASASNAVFFNYPTGDDDPPLSGEELVVSIAAVDSADTLNSNVRLDVAAYLKSDTDLENGEMYVKLYFAGMTASDEGIRTAVTTAAEIWRDIASDFGVTLSIETEDWQEGALPKPGTGAPDEFEAISSQAPLRTVNVVVVPSVLGSEEILGATGSVPGPVSPSGYSAVVISAAANAGPDLEFSEDEVQLLAETMAHETGHYLGLFHPVESTWDKWDAISDTVECNDRDVCEDELGNNLMFPYPVCDEVACQMQDSLTVSQKALIHRYAGMR